MRDVEQGARVSGEVEAFGRDPGDARPVGFQRGMVESRGQCDREGADVARRYGARSRVQTMIDTV